MCELPLYPQPPSAQLLPTCSVPSDQQLVDIRLCWIVNAGPGVITVVSDEARLAEIFVAEQPSGSVRVITTEQVLFGAASESEVIVRDQASASLPLHLPAAQIHEVEGVDAVAEVVAELLANSHRTPQAPVVAVLNAVGGAGASTVAWLIATHYSQIHTTVLIDADDRSAGLDLWTCQERAAAVRWNELHDINSAVEPRRLWDCLIRVSSTLRLLSHGRVSVTPSAASFEIVLNALAEHALVIDLSSARSHDWSSYVIDSADLVIVVSTATVSGCASVKAQIAQIANNHVGADQRLVCALRASRFGVSLMTARSVVAAPLVTVPEDVQFLRSLRDRRTKSSLNRRWNSLIELLPLPESDAALVRDVAQSPHPSPLQTSRGVRTSPRGGTRLLSIPQLASAVKRMAQRL